jgi:hypothetical protein
VHQRRFDQRYLAPENWGQWRFRWDPEEKGVEDRWFRPDPADGEEWTPVDVPAFLAETPAGNGIGYGWYRTTFTLPETRDLDSLGESFARIALPRMKQIKGLAQKVSQPWWHKFKTISDEARELIDPDAKPEAGVEADFGY